MTHDQFPEIAQGVAQTPNPKTPFDTVSVMLTLAPDLFNGYGCERRGDIISALLDAYDVFIRPLDIPLVPNAIEPAVDEAGKIALEQALNVLADQICKSDD